MRNAKTCKYCSKKSLAKGLCPAHYQRFRTGSTLVTPIKQFRQRCAVCGQKHFGLGLCNRHYKQVRWLAIKKVLVAACGDICVDCHRTFPWNVYDFHHRNPQEKSFEISDEMHRKLPELLVEAKKCDLLCTNCHRIRHASQAEWSDLLDFIPLFTRRIS